MVPTGEDEKSVCTNVAPGILLRSGSRKTESKAFRSVPLISKHRLLPVQEAREIESVEVPSIILFRLAN